MMAFEQNQQLQQLLNYSGNGGFRQQTPSFGMQSIPQQGGGGFWNGLKNFAVGSPAQFSYSSPYTEDQRSALMSLLQSGQYNQQNPYEGFDVLQNQLMRDFRENLVPQLSEQFTGMTGGAPSSGVFSQQLNKGVEGLAQRLMQHKINYGQQNRQFGLQQANVGLTPQFQNSYVPAQAGALQSLLGAVPQITQAGLRSYFGGLL